MRKKRMKRGRDRKISDRELAELLDRIYVLDPEKEEVLLEESYKEGLRGFLREEDEDE